MACAGDVFKNYFTVGENNMTLWTFREMYNKFCDSSTTVNPNDIPFIIWLLENPKSLFHLHGACDLHKHDLIHVLLDVGQSNDDEAFVIGFTMGNDNRISPWEVKFFKYVSSKFYPLKNRFNDKQLKIFDKGFEYGRSRHYNNIARFDWNSIDWDLPFYDIQYKFGIFDNELDYYKTQLGV